MKSLSGEGRPLAFSIMSSLTGLAGALAAPGAVLASVPAAAPELPLLPLLAHPAAASIVPATRSETADADQVWDSLHRLNPFFLGVMW
ncbi:hypothetical protein SD70_02190 [Gordoniibacillus kamchatkensis]|uniref:Uncharacterized protein n=1 Tax=Gordoniibacillus kamchatkensis TaxID=1590651 RepID=A0ABR5APN6_9BACL|nr:hypothetical protein SD70_02190 [Paenibacillus sp. VKM B-2647]